MMIGKWRLRGDFLSIMGAIVHRILRDFITTTRVSGRYTRVYLMQCNESGGFWTGLETLWGFATGRKYVISDAIP